MHELLKKINKSEINNVNLYLFSKPRDKKKFSVFSTIIKEDNVKIDMKKIIENQIRNHVENEDNIYEYNPIFDNKSIIQKINCNELEFLPKFINKIGLECKVYDEKKLDKGHKLWLFVIVIDDGSEQIIAFQKIRTKTLLKNEKYRILFDNGIKRFEEPLLQLEQKMDCICILKKNADITHQIMYIFDKYWFELIFGFEEKFRREIQDKLKNFENEQTYDTNLIDIDQLYKKVENNSNHLKKLYVILKNDNFKYLNEENIKKVENKSKIKFNRPTGKIELNTNEDVKKILNFLNEDFLESIISEKPYVVSNKIDI